MRKSEENTLIGSYYANKGVINFTKSITGFSWIEN